MILHVDMDAFYASIEQRDQPRLRGRPVIVGGSRSGRGVVAAASYEARAFGVRSAMSGRRASQLCPDGVFVKSDLRRYAEVGRQVREIFRRFTPIIQPLSLDEAFLDVSGTEHLFGFAEAIGREIQQTIRSELNLPASVGIAPVKFAAKIASDLDKPRGFVTVSESELQQFLDPLPVERLWGVGSVGLTKLHRLGIRRLVDLRTMGQASCIEALGRWGEHLYLLATGRDDRKVVPDHRARQLGHERTFPEDVRDPEMLDSVASYLCEQVGMRLRAAHRLAGSVHLKYRLHDFRTFSRSLKLAQPSDATDELLGAARICLATARQRYQAPVRLIGVSVGHLSATDAPRQLSLFDQELTERQQSVDRLSDQLKERFGPETLYRASGHAWVRRDKSS